LLATAVFNNESASGWQQVNFSQPVAIKANTLYIASYHSNGYYALNLDYFANSGHANGVLYAPQTTDVYNHANGVFPHGGAPFPDQSYRGINYWVDAVFQTNSDINPPPTANAGPDQTGNEGASIQFNGSASGAAPLSYTWNFGDGGTTSGTLT